MFHVNSVKVKHPDWGPQGSESSRLEDLGTSAFTFEFYANQDSVSIPTSADASFTSY